MDTVAVLSSGGLDSYIAYRYSLSLNQNTKIVTVDYGQPYLLKEQTAIKSLHSNDEVIWVKADCAHTHLQNVPTLTQQEVYGRNLLLAYYGALIGNRVWMVSLEPESNPYTVRDKSPEFFQLTSGLLTFLLKGRQHETIIESPFKHLTKTEEVTLGLKLGISIEEMTTTSSCYHDEYKACGCCSTCFKRWISFTNNGFSENYVKHPYLENEYANTVCSIMRNSIQEFYDSGKYDRQSINNLKYSWKRKLETHNALVRNDFQGIFPTSDILSMNTPIGFETSED